MSTVTFDYQGAVVIITGGSSGIGRAIAEAYGQAGANVVIASRNEADGDEVAALVNEAGGRAFHHLTDVSDPADVESLVNTTVSEYGRLDIAVNNAGTLPPTADLIDQSIDDWNKAVAVDLSGVFHSLKYEISAMLKTGGGSIVNTSSVAGLIADPGMSPYAASKHGVLGLTKAAALDYAKKNIRVNAIAPGLVQTAMIEDWLNDPEMRETVLGYSPQGRVAEPREIADTVLYLTSDSASFINGTVLAIDGGQTAH
ncbi:glucose 1-dehydrogenase [Brevibacterium permense]|uniref:SDR family NAD(P)-dependent oxidoreductase n=1 Tax=Brevibacterium permense TaxID=234834 RepID=UPI0021CE5CE9|nr:glucose 1-dehydrogenase [Brevibacterium permense]MCU4298796.1 glucose 1-dehydrogenase [Brevibacterium permense]